MRLWAYSIAFSMKKVLMKKTGEGGKKRQKKGASSSKGSHYLVSKKEAGDITGAVE